MTNDKNTEEDNFVETNNNDYINDDTQDTQEEVTEDNHKDTNLQKDLAIQSRILKREGFEKVDGKWVKAKKKEEKTNDNSGFSREEGKIYSKIFSSSLPEELADKAIDQISKIAKIENVSLDEAYKSEYFNVWKDKEVKEFKNKKAQLGVSRGSTPKVKKTLQSSGLSRDEHQALWREKNNL